MKTVSFDTDQTALFSYTWADGGAHLRVYKVCGACFFGELDMTSADVLERGLIPLIEASIATIDLSYVGFADSTLINAVARLLRRREARSGNRTRLHIIGARPSVVRLFRITGLDADLEFYDVPEAGMRPPDVRSIGGKLRATAVHSQTQLLYIGERIQAARPIFGGRYFDGQ